MRQTQVNNNAVIRWIAFIIGVALSIAIYRRTVYENEVGSYEYEKCINALKIKK